MAFERSKKKFTTKIIAHYQRVNTPTPYETIIAQKLEQLPVPDMADSIWASIQLQLDADLPGEDGDNSPSNNPTKGLPGMGKAIYFSIFTAVIIAIILIYKTNKNNTKKKNNLPVPAKIEIITPIADSSPILNTPVEKSIATAPKVTSKKDSITTAFNPGNRISFDSLTRQDVSVSNSDSGAVLKNKPPLPAVDAPPLPPAIKPKGVRGITNDDYKIQSVKNDSLKKGG
jgi:hypothetical protein